MRKNFRNLNEISGGNGTSADKKKTPNPVGTAEENRKIVDALNLAPGGYAEDELNALAKKKTPQTPLAGKGGGKPNDPTTENICSQPRGMR